VCFKILIEVINFFRPKVFEAGLYTIKVGNPDVGKMKIIRNIQSLTSDTNNILNMIFNNTAK